jgi:hypothetical protein
MGFKTIGARLDFEKLWEAPLTLIVHWDKKHFLAIYHASITELQTGILPTIQTQFPPYCTRKFFSHPEKKSIFCPAHTTFHNSLKRNEYGRRI